MKSLWNHITVIQMIMVPVVWTLYYEKSILKFKPPNSLRPDAYFGYSVTYQPMSKNSEILMTSYGAQCQEKFNCKTLIISAPRADSVGHVYACVIASEKCDRIPTNITREFDQYKHDYWFGATVKAGPSYFVTCAPRYTARDNTYKAIGTFGRCYKQAHGSSGLVSLPFITINNRVKGTNKFEQTVDSFGWSIDVAPDGSVLVGGPAMFTGRAMRYPTLTEAPAGISGVNDITKYNFGYSVSSGYFTSKTKLLYAVGSPYGEDSSGVVLFFKAMNGSPLRKIYQPDDLKQIGAMFGAVLCSAEISGAATDILVGAPTYATEHTYNKGAVFFYVQLKFKRVIIGQKSGSYFGSAIVSVGDLNGDGKDEIAIAAPYEDEGRGAVYLYCGAEILQNKPGKPFGWLQRIQPEGYRAFGLSLSAVQDYDENGCYELAIGAPDNDTVTVMRCMAAVTIEMYADFPNLQNRNTHPSNPKMNASYFKFQSCVKAKYPAKPPHIIASVSVKVEIEHPNAVLANATSDAIYTEILNRNEPIYCRNVGVSLPLNGNYDLMIGYTLSATLLDNPMDLPQFNESRVVLSDRSKLTDHGSVSAAECRNKDSCAPQLEGEIYTTMGSSYTIGSTDVENVTVVMYNKPEGDVAYASCVAVHVQGAFVLSVPGACRRAPGDVLTCTPPQPLRANNTWNTGKILIKTAKLTNKDREIKISAKIYNSCNKGDHITVRENVVKLVANSSGIAVTGQSNLGALVNITRNEVKYTGKQIEHRYRIVNYGPTNWVEATCKIVLPKKPYIKYSEKPVSAFTFDSREICCIVNSTSDDQIVVHCEMMEGLKKHQPISVNVAITIDPGKLDNIIDKENVTVYTNMSVILDVGTISTSVETTLMLYELTVPLWVIIIATLVGVLLLVIIALALRECGLLRRKNQEKLKELRKSVRRQTIRRSMVTAPVDREKLVDVADEADEAAEGTSCDETTGNRVKVLPTSVKFTK